MLINQPGAEFLYNGITYRIGGKIVGSDQSEYAGLIGSILEIRDGDDKETENDTPDMNRAPFVRQYDIISNGWGDYNGKRSAAQAIHSGVQEAGN